MRLPIFNAIILMSLLTISGCIATTYGEQPIPDPVEKNVYTFTLYKNMFASTFGDGYMKRKADEQINIIMQEHGYKRFEILNADKENFVANKNTYRVKFYEN